ncbi:MAG: DUF2238 domain-containing protein [Sulfuricurvum sp.]|uniref:DUF2238 domain-containing protein n=1 Tax=Sulfuricurvum sp. TaxID=2025608 RepID=UPI002603F34E|nr:DUF2238 domain-containing protein [Sulfuricurvum sp.]MDD2829204.1 DUF2238 domain-containing protein [Sulfuricurvum sp.]MDD4949037.1 DUF2238 domain-containing protein [Sulfuricurvum sp.]
MDKKHILMTGFIIIILLLLYSGIYAYDRVTWLMEIFPIIIVLPVLIKTYKSFPLTTLLYSVIFLHMIVLIFGGMYTYARVPLGFEIAQWLEMDRNPYDKIGHFMQGFSPALISYEVLIRGNYINGKKMLLFIVVSIVLAISATYELIEWGAALWMGQGADEFLGTQGYMWDTQSDMFFALIGAIIALSVFRKIHDKAIRRL